MEPASGRLAPVTLCPVLHSSTEQVCSVFCVAAPSCEKTPLCLPAPSPRPSTPGALDSRPVCSSALAGPAGHSGLRPGPRVPGSALTALCRRPMLLPDVCPSCRRCLSGRRAEREERDSRGRLSHAPHPAVVAPHLALQPLVKRGRFRQPLLVRLCGRALACARRRLRSQGQRSVSPSSEGAGFVKPWRGGG